MKNTHVVFKLFIATFIIASFFIPKNLHTVSIKNCYRKSFQQLSLYHYLDLLQKLTIEQADLSEEDKKTSDSVKEVLCLMSNITTNFNDKVLFYNPDMEYHFFEICDYFDSPNDIKLRHMRGLKNKVLKFNEKLDKYLKMRKPFLRSSDLKLLNNIQLFNELLINRLLTDSFLDTGFTDEFMDLFFYRPCEFARKYKKLAVSGAIVISALISYFFLYPVIQGFLEDYNLSKNNSKKYDVKQFKVVRQDGAECGYHALINALIFESSDTEDGVKEKLNKNVVEVSALKKLKTIIKSKRMNDSGEIDVLGDLSLKDKIAVIVAEKEEADGDQWFLNLGVYSGEDGRMMIARQLMHRIKMNGDQWLNGGEIEVIMNKHDEELKRCLGVDVDGSNILVIEEHEVRMKNKPERLQASIDMFKAHGSMQSFVIRSGQHWIAAKIMKDEHAKNGIKTWVANSMQANITDDKNLEAVIDLYFMKET